MAWNLETELLGTWNLNDREQGDINDLGWEDYLDRNQEIEWFGMRRREKFGTKRPFGLEPR
jgi:hypothetical protein